MPRDGRHEVEHRLLVDQHFVVETQRLQPFHAPPAVFQLRGCFRQLELAAGDEAAVAS